MKIEDLPLALSIEQAAEALQVKRSALYEAVREGDIRSVRIGRKIRVPRAAIAEFLGESIGDLDHTDDTDPDAVA